MKPMSFERTIAAPVESVWAALTDIPRRAELFSKIDVVEPLTDGPFGLGTRWRETRTVYGQSSSANVEVVELDAPHRFLTESVVGPRSTMEYVLLPARDGASTTVRVTSETTGGSLIYKIGEALGRSRITQCIVENNTQDLIDLAHDCESRRAS
ncbi:SRPBCC family protein [Planobispora longispora]|nr:SRPBCC family protein [Planobispora longispora]